MFWNILLIFVGPHSPVSSAVTMNWGQGLTPVCTQDFSSDALWTVFQGMQLHLAKCVFVYVFIAVLCADVHVDMCENARMFVYLYVCVCAHVCMHAHVWLHSVGTEKELSFLPFVTQHKCPFEDGSVTS